MWNARKGYGKFSLGLGYDWGGASLRLESCGSVHCQSVISFRVHARRGAVQSHFEEAVIVIVAWVAVSGVVSGYLDPVMSCSKQPLGIFCCWLVVCMVSPLGRLGVCCCIVC